MDPYIEELNRLVLFVPILGKMGLSVESATKDSVTAKIPFEGNGNHLGTVYAGVLFSLAEFTGVTAIYNKLGIEGILYIMKDMSIRYKKPATTDLTVTATFTDENAANCKAGLEKHEKLDFLMEIEIKDATGEVVALTKNLYHLRKA